LRTFDVHDEITFLRIIIFQTLSGFGKRISVSISHNYLINLVLGVRKNGRINESSGKKMFVPGKNGCNIVPIQNFPESVAFFGIGIKAISHLYSYRKSRRVKKNKSVFFGVSGQIFFQPGSLNSVDNMSSWIGTAQNHKVRIFVVKGIANPLELLWSILRWSKKRIPKRKRNQVMISHHRINRNSQRRNYFFPFGKVFFALFSGALVAHSNQKINF
jgi:hypothetical protein